MGLTLSSDDRTVFGDKRIALADVTFDSSYPRGGEALTPGQFGMTAISDVISWGTGARVRYDSTNSKLKVLEKDGPIGVTLHCEDDDDAASHGVVVYLHVPTATVDFARETGDLRPVVGWLEFISPTNADGEIPLSNGDAIKVYDDDAANTGGIQVYIDEDEAVCSPVQANVATLLRSAVVRTVGGNYVLISHDASAAANGVALYFDEDGAAGNKLEFVSPTNADSEVNVDPELTPTADLAGTVARVLVIGN